MILVASQRGGGQNLAAHLMRADENEHVEVHEVNGFASDDLKKAFKEVEAISRATKCRQYLFSLSLNPPDHASVSIAQFEETIGRVEQKLGLAGQPRAVVFHEKEGRRHCHVVWSRINTETLTAKQMSFFKTKLQALSRDLYLENEWQMPRGMIDSALRDPRNFNLAEWQQAKRTGTDPRVFKAAVQMCWERSDSVQAFESALGERGLFLAKGDRRGHVIVDSKGEVWSLARTLAIKAKDVRHRLGDADRLPSVATAHRQNSDRLSPVLKNYVEEARQRFQARSAKLDYQKMRMRDSHRGQREVLHETQCERSKAEALDRAAKLPRGLSGLWSRLTGRHQAIRRTNELDAERCRIRDRAERETLVSSQLEERRVLQSTIKAHRKAQAELLWSIRDDRTRLKAKIDQPVRRQTRRRSP